MHRTRVIVFLLDVAVLYRTMGTTVFESGEFQIYVNKTANTQTNLETVSVRSIVQCAAHCLSNAFCESFSLNCLAFKSGNKDLQNCHLYNSSISSDLDLNEGEGCYVQKLSSAQTTAGTSIAVTTTTVEPASSSPTQDTTLTTTITTTTTAGPLQDRTAVIQPPATITPTSLVIDIVYGPKDICSSGSGNDFLLLTSVGVYVYDEVADLTMGSCKGPVDFTSIFTDYQQIPGITDVRGVLLYQSSNVELYAADDNVYKWQLETGRLNNVLGSTTYSNHLGTTALNGKDFVWAAYRQGSSQERHFYLGGDLFLLKSDQYGTRSFNKTDEVRDQNGFNMNPWSNIPSNTVAVAGYGNEPRKNFVVIDAKNMVYTYQLDHSIDNNNPTKVLTPLNIDLKF